MSLLLLIETATISCSVAMAENGAIIASLELNQRNAHAEMITVFIDDLFKRTEKTVNEIDAVCVSSGPGSYTGLRIGVSTAKGLCFALDKPLISVETLSSMAHGLIRRNEVDIDAETWLCPMIDARRMEVYTAFFDARGHQVIPTAAEIIDEHSFAAILGKRRIIFFGDGAEKCHEVLSKNPNAFFIDGFVNSANDLLSPAVEKFTGRIFEDVAYFEPYYLKDFIAGVKNPKP